MEVRLEKENNRTLVMKRDKVGHHGEVDVVWVEDHKNKAAWVEVSVAGMSYTINLPKRLQNKIFK